MLNMRKVQNRMLQQIKLKDVPCLTNNFRISLLQSLRSHRSYTPPGRFDLVFSDTSDSTAL